MSAVGSGDIDGQQIGRGVYTIDPERSVISFQTRALFGVIRVRGTFGVEGGKITVADPVEESTAEATVSAVAFASGNAKRDEHVRSEDYLDATRYPRFSFVSERFEWSGDHGTLRGQLTVKEAKQQVTLDVSQVSGDERSLTARATTTIDRFAFGVKTAPGMTGRNLHIVLDIIASR
ncbi:YceI family protein [Saccharomonospora saliphila]|uniref:YceI family protein n=1 Tax=Saccharomonospora saliphila TaxID=369829 RepID=UPI00039D93E6|nr:YceI family protein [Saccharomonospora saliphila]